MDLVRRGVQSVDAFWALLAEDVVWETVLAPLPDAPAVCVGRDAVIEASRRRDPGGDDPARSSVRLQSPPRTSPRRPVVAPRPGCGRGRLDFETFTPPGRYGRPAPAPINRPLRGVALSAIGRLDSNQRPLGPQPTGGRCRCVPGRPPRPPRPRTWTFWTDKTQQSVLARYHDRAGPNRRDRQR